MSLWGWIAILLVISVIITILIHVLESRDGGYGMDFADFIETLFIVIIPRVFGVAILIAIFWWVLPVVLEVFFFY